MVHSTIRAAVPAIAAASLFVALVAVLPGQRHLVVTAHAVQPTTRLLVSEAQFGTWTNLPGFPSDGLPPRAVAYDPLNGDAIVALDTGSGGSRIVRVRTTAPVFEWRLADLPAAVVDVTVIHRGDVYAVAESPPAQAGLWRIPRRGGAPVRVLPLVDPAAITAFGPESTFAVVAQSGTPGPPSRDATLVYVDVAAGTATPQPSTQVARAVVAALDLPTAVPRTLLAHPDGSLTLVEGFSNPRSVQVTNPGPGNVRTLSWETSGSILALGGAVDPYLKTLPPIPPVGVPVPWTRLVGPMPGDPIDMDAMFDGAASWRFGDACGTGGSISSSGSSLGPTLGDGSFAIQLQSAAAAAPAILALGFRDDTAQSAGGAPLPAALPSGCSLLVDPEALFFATTNAMGNATHPLPVPNQTSLLGLRVYSQWLLWQGVPFEVTAALSMQVGS